MRMKNLTIHRTLRSCGLAVTVFILGGVLMYYESSLTHSVKPPVNRLVPRKISVQIQADKLEHSREFERHVREGKSGGPEADGLKRYETIATTPTTTSLSKSDFERHIKARIRGQSEEEWLERYETTTTPNQSKKEFERHVREGKSGGPEADGLKRYETIATTPTTTSLSKSDFERHIKARIRGQSEEEWLERYETTTTPNQSKKGATTTNTTQKDTSSKSVHILLSAYHRSGSSFTGNLLASQPNTFYFFEPLIELLNYGHITADNQICDDLNGECRTVNGSADELKPLNSHMKRYNVSAKETFGDVIRHLLHNIYQCKLEGTEDLIVEGITDSFTSTLRRLWNDYGWCRRNQSKHDCFSLVDDSCRNSEIRVIKVVRLCLDVAAPLLEEDPSLKLVHLFRDPRGTIASRLVKTGWYPLFVANGDYSRVAKNAEILCKRMLKDYESGLKLRRIFPNRVILIRYEDLNYESNYRDAFKSELLHFLDFNSSALVQNSESRSSGDWIRTLNWRVIQIVDYWCSSVYKKLGYIQLDYQTWLDSSF